MDRLPEDVRKREKVYDWLAIFFGTIGGIALILLGVVSLALDIREAGPSGRDSDGMMFASKSISLTLSTTLPFIGP